MNKKTIVSFCLTLLSFSSLYATHEMAGQITYASKEPGNAYCLTYYVTVTTYSDMTSMADRCSMLMDFGDGSKDSLFRTNCDPSTNTLCSPKSCGGVPVGVSFPNVKQNIYFGEHTFPHPGSFIISVKDPNRVTGICNIVNSVNVQFYLQSLVVINYSYGSGSSPVPSNLAIDRACAGYFFYHDSRTTDPDGDSLIYSLQNCVDTTNTTLVGYSSPPVTTGGSLSVDPVSGILSWLNPPDICEFVVCLRIEQWRKIKGVYYYLGYVYQNMLIVVAACTSGNTAVLQTAPIKSQLLVYPNPSSSDITFELLTNGSPQTPIGEVLDIFDLSGRKVISLSGFSGDKLLLQAKTLAAGSYLYKLHLSDLTELKGKFLINP